MSNRQAEPARTGSKSSRVPLDSRDERDAESIFLTIESEFRRTLEAEQTFMAWRRDTPNAPFAERLRRYAAWAEASQPFAASYRRISTAFPGYMDRLQELLLCCEKSLCPTDRRRSPRDSSGKFGRSAENPEASSALGVF